jgi:hypothetical protein
MALRCCTRTVRVTLKCAGCMSWLAILTVATVPALSM